MRIIISPAKRMKVDSDFTVPLTTPKFIKEAGLLLEYLRDLSYGETKEMWKCNDKIAKENYERIQRMNLYEGLTPAILSYEGIQYQYMGPGVFADSELDYIDEHLRIMSGFYGILRPFDMVSPYRLEMQSKLPLEKINSLYEFWGEKLADELFSQSKDIVNLASKEYSRCISAYIKDDIRFINCVFGEIKEEKVLQKGTLVKMARGEMVRFMAENNIKDVEEIKEFNRLGYSFVENLSDHSNYVFVKTLDKL